MKMTNTVQVNFDISQTFVSKDYEKVIDYADDIQKKLLFNWHVKNKKVLEQLIIQSRNILNIWISSIAKKRLWMALVRCGAWIGTLETLEKSIYEESMDLWAQRRLQKSISSIKHVSEIVGLLEVKGVMTHSEMVEELHLKHASTLTEIIKKTSDLELIEIRKAGKFNLYSLTDTGVRYAKQLRTGRDKQALLKGIIQEYDLRMSEAVLDSYLQSADEKMSIKLGQMIKVNMDGEWYPNSKVKQVLRKTSYDEELQEATEAEYLFVEKSKAKLSVYEAGERAYG